MNSVSPNTRTIKLTPPTANADTSKISNKLKDMGKQIFELYTSIPSVEIWTDTTIQGTVKQIGFYWDSGLFSSVEDALMVCSDLKLAISDIQKQAELGKKFISEEMKNVNKDNYSVYSSEIEITNNCVLVSLGNTKQVYLGHQTFNTMSTANINYCNEILVFICYGVFFILKPDFFSSSIIFGFSSDVIILSPVNMSNKPNVPVKLIL